jgi:hypothetical protein
VNAEIRRSRGRLAFPCFRAELATAIEKLRKTEMPNVETFITDSKLVEKESH